MSETAVTEAFRSSEPTIRVGERTMSARELGLMSLSVRENTSGLYRCEATFVNWGAEHNGSRFAFFDKEVFDFGTHLSIDMGDGEAVGTVFVGKITALEGRFPRQSPPELLVLAEDRLQDLRMVRRTRSWENTTINSLFSRIGGEHGLRLDMDFDGPTYEVLAQVNQSDLAFMRECVRRVDAELWVDSGMLRVRKRASRGREEISFSYGYRLLEFSVCADLAGQRTSTVMSGWDVAAKQAIFHEAKMDTMRTELGDDTGGGRILQNAFGDRTERIVHEVAMNNSEIREAAQAGYRRMARRFVTGKGLVDGDGRLRVGIKVRLDGLGPFFDGPYYVSEVTHSFDTTNGYRSFFQVERPGIGGY
ncbi:MAG: hypothetical protein GF344_01095 [Chitinivibrionales bacterium]|nr:hypothetical protein [Chitinivibrionales bacterium]MBD3355697.1 hypothetical protein [Chitinivibrionales bacterium]